MHVAHRGGRPTASASRRHVLPDDNAHVTRLAGRVLGAVLLSSCLAAVATAQAPAPAGALRPAAGTATPGDGETATRFHDATRLPLEAGAFPMPRVEGPRPAPWWAPLASAAVPGSGQAAMRQDRWIAYAAIEGVAWLRWATDQHEARRERRAYQRIANQVARALYSDGTPLAGSFEYYETMEKWTESGVYDAQPGGTLEPETDVLTFNGATWLLARQTFWPSPDEPPPVESVAYQNAIRFYDERAIRPEFRWSWRDAALQQDLYRRAIIRSNAAYRRAAQDLAAVLANHVLSTVDAYVTVRLRRRPTTAGTETRLEATLPWPGRRSDTGR